MIKLKRVAQFLTGFVLMLAPAYWLLSAIYELPYALVLQSFTINSHGGKQIGFTVSVLSFLVGYVLTMKAFHESRSGLRSDFDKSRGSNPMLYVASTQDCRAFVERHGWHCTFFESTDWVAALNTVKDGDVVVLPLIIAYVDPIELFTYVKSISPGVKTVALTHAPVADPNALFEYKIDLFWSYHETLDPNKIV